VRIAYVINSMEGGGAAFPVPAVGRMLTKLGAQVEVYALTRRDGRATAPIEKAGMMVHVRPGGERDHIGALSWLTRRLAGQRPDVIWTSLTRATLLGQVVGARLNTPVVSWQHAAYLKPANRLLLKARQKRSALWIADSDRIAELTMDRLAVPRDRMAVLPLFIADPEAPEATPWKPGQVIRIGTLGRLHPVKGYDVLVAAIAKIQTSAPRPPHRFEVLIAGSGAEQDALTSAITAAGLDNVRLKGFEGNPRDFLASLHLYVQPSRSEGLCIAAHEAMQAGLPTVVSSVGELPNSVRDGETGLVVPPGDADALAQAIGWFLTHPQKLAEMGSAARSRVLTRFSAEAFEAAGADLYGRLPIRPRRAS
jgi:glycosyltransferase involved in cell wall biosynthesis